VPPDTRTHMHVRARARAHTHTHTLSLSRTTRTAAYRQNSRVQEGVRRNVSAGVRVYVCVHGRGRVRGRVRVHICTYRYLIMDMYVNVYSCRYINTFMHMHQCSVPLHHLHSPTYTYMLGVNPYPYMRRCIYAR